MHLLTRPREHLFFSPDPHIKKTPRSIHVPYEMINIFQTCAKDELHVVTGWWIPSRLSQKRVILYCQGAHGNMSHHLDMVKFVHEYLPHFSLFVFDYPGFGDSGTSSVHASISGCQFATWQAYQWLRGEKGLEAKNIVLWGDDFGAFFACYLANVVDTPFAGLVLRQAFPTVTDYIKERWTSYLFTWAWAWCESRHLQCDEVVKRYVANGIPVVCLDDEKSSAVVLLRHMASAKVVLYAPASPLFVHATDICRIVTTAFGGEDQAEDERTTMTNEQL